MGGRHGGVGGVGAGGGGRGNIGSPIRRCQCKCANISSGIRYDAMGKA